MALLIPEIFPGGGEISVGGGWADSTKWQEGDRGVLGETSPPPPMKSEPTQGAWWVTLGQSPPSVWPASQDGCCQDKRGKEEVSPLGSPWGEWGGGHSGSNTAKNQAQP